MPIRLPVRAARVLAVFAALWSALLLGVRADLQFDAFVGYENIVRAGGWYPVGFEVFNDGPSFEGTIEVSGSQFGGQSLQYAVSLPNGTRKRIVLPSFSASAGFMSVDARLLDASGKVRAERLALRPTLLGWEGVLVGSLAAASQGGPVFPTLDTARQELQPRTARLMTEFFPDNPIALEGLNAIYVNSARALDLKEPQIEALMAWLHAGGHLIVAIDQPADLNTATWLRAVLPADVGALANRRTEGELQQWLTEDAAVHPTQSVLRHTYESPKFRNQAEGRADPTETIYAKQKEDRDFDSAELAVVALKPVAGSVTYGAKDAPFLVSAPKGRGLVTLLAFNPERDPFKTWKNRPYFWARMTGVPDEVFKKESQNIWGGKSLDAVFGAMTETRQVRKLPITMLLLLLVVYLVVIGPLDQWWLKKINRPMLTWITFPTYVALFSLLIYFIGFKLRAGQTEWNELHLVDVLPKGGDAVLRGRTFASIYSPANETYKVGSDLPHATMRSEFAGLWGGTQGEAKTGLSFSQKPGFTAGIYVPVWSSQLNISDWQQTATPPITATVAVDGKNATLRVQNPGGHAFGGLWVVHRGEMHELGELAAGASKDFALAAGNGSRPLRLWVQQFGDRFRGASQARERVLGGNEGTHIDDWDRASVAASFPGILSLNENQTRDFVFPAGMDLTSLADRGETLLFAWMPGEIVVPALNKFTPLRTQKGTLLRLAVPVAK